MSARNGSTKIAKIFPLKQNKLIFRGLVRLAIKMTENIAASAFTNTQHLTIYQYFFKILPIGKMCVACFKLQPKK